LCQGQGGGEVLAAVLGHEDGGQDAFHGGAILEGTDRAGAAADFAEAPLDLIRSARGLATLRALNVRVRGTCRSIMPSPASSECA
jgi:hypothetical protein